MTTLDRRTFLRTISVSSSAIVLAPLFTACSDEGDTTSTATSATTGGEPAPHDPLAIPRSKPADWDPIEFNRTRGHAGAIPASYLPAIDAPDGATQALGKHLPYVPDLTGVNVPAGMIALMWGDPSRGYARHPNSAPDASNQMRGHWFNWIEIRKATEDTAVDQHSEYPEWPGDASHFKVLGGGDLTADSGKNTIYLAALPPDVRPGDTVRIHAHCLTHGEYVDFLVVPG